MYISKNLREVYICIKVYTTVKLILQECNDIQREVLCPKLSTGKNLSASGLSTNSHPNDNLLSTYVS